MQAKLSAGRLHLNGLLVLQAARGLTAVSTSRVHSHTLQSGRLACLRNVHAARGLEPIVGDNVWLALQHPPQLLLLNALLSHAAAQRKLLVQGEPAKREAEGGAKMGQAAAAAGSGSGGGKPDAIARLRSALTPIDISHCLGEGAAPPQVTAETAASANPRMLAHVLTLPPAFSAAHLSL